MKGFDKFTYYTMKILGIAEIAVLSYIIFALLFGIVNNIIIVTAILMIFILTFLLIPYLILIIMVGIAYLVRLIKYKGKKGKQIIKMFILLIVIVYSGINGIMLFPLTNRYELKVNKNLSQLQNVTVREYVESSIIKDKYIYKIIIIQGFPDDYNVRIYYKDNGIKVKHTFLSDNARDFIQANFSNVTDECFAKSIILLVLADVLLIRLLKISTRFYKKLTSKNNILQNIR